MPAAIDQASSSTSDLSSSVDQGHSEAEVSKLQKVFWSLFIGFHLFAILIAPLSFRAQGPLGPSPIIETLSQPTRGYGQFLYVDRGYAFFAPDPGPSHLIQAAITSEDGSRKEIMVPDLDEQWPRLIYHRHFMLAEYLNEIYQPKGPPRELLEADRESAEEWRRLRARYEHLRDSVLDHLRSVNPKKEVAVRRVEHLVPDLTLYLQEPIALDDKRLYQVLFDNPISLGPPAPRPAPNEAQTNVRGSARSTPRPNARELTAPNRKLSPPKKPPETIPVPKASLPRKAGSDVDHTKEEQRVGTGAP